MPALNLAGIPPFSGFLGKLGLLQAGVAAGGALPYALVVGGVVTSLLTLLAVVAGLDPGVLAAPQPGARRRHRGRRSGRHRPADRRR